MDIFSKNQVTCDSSGILGAKHCPVCHKETVWLLCVARTWFSFLSLHLIPLRKEYLAACSECKNGLEMSKATFDVLKMKLECGDTIGRIEDAIRFPDKSSLQIREILKAESEEQAVLKEMEELEQKELEHVLHSAEETRKRLSDLEAELIGKPAEEENAQKVTGSGPDVITDKTDGSGPDAVTQATGDDSDTV
ncbi:MAG: hypothetical protein JW817_08080 [Clostridiales bacterium]|nr:hypothetical protein [Clostridiales bacterium]